MSVRLAGEGSIFRADAPWAPWVHINQRGLRWREKGQLVCSECTRKKESEEARRIPRQTRLFVLETMGGGRGGQQRDGEEGCDARSR